MSQQNYSVWSIAIFKLGKKLQKEVVQNESIEINI
jgi:hypothetical protein